jgi:CheY-like chemotaxis protein
VRAPTSRAPAAGPKKPRKTPSPPPRHERLASADRMASLGTLAAGLAHEINNPLASLIGNLEVISAEIEELSGRTPRLRALGEVVAESRAAAERVRRIVRDLRLFSHADEEKRGPVDVNATVVRALDIVDTTARQRATVLRDLTAEHAIEGGEQALCQVVVNLLLNAAQAIPEGNPDKNTIRASTYDEDGLVVIEVRDSGAGIPSKDIARIFDPFFTTKPIGIGTGLGLAVCHGIVTSMGGQIDVESSVGKGSAFRVLLPRGKARPTPPAPRVSSSRRARVLIIDDDVLVLRSLRRVLATEHTITTSERAHEALELLRSGDRFDVILCDLMMPGMTGMELYDAIELAMPDLLSRMIFITGGAFTARAREFLVRVPNRRFEKPIGADDLRAAVRDLLR